eukprot:875405-Rhodomonas_salina.1
MSAFSCALRCCTPPPPAYAGGPLRPGGPCNPAGPTLPPNSQPQPPIPQSALPALAPINPTFPLIPHRALAQHFAISKRILPHKPRVTRGRDVGGGEASVPLGPVGPVFPGMPMGPGKPCGPVLPLASAAPVTHTPHNPTEPTVLGAHRGVRQVLPGPACPGRHGDRAVQGIPALVHEMSVEVEMLAESRSA